MDDNNYFNSGSSDVTLLNSSVTMLRGGQVDTNTIMFSLPVDQVAQEIEETFSIRLVPDRILVSPLAVIELEDQLDVTIIDIDGEFKDFKHASVAIARGLQKIRVPVYGTCSEHVH